MKVVRMNENKINFELELSKKELVKAMRYNLENEHTMLEKVVWIDEETGENKIITKEEGLYTENSIYLDPKRFVENWNGWSMSKKKELKREIEEYEIDETVEEAIEYENLDIATGVEWKEKGIEPYENLEIRYKE